MENEELGLEIDPKCCSGCQIGLYRSKHGIRNADCCRWCNNIDMQHKERLEAIKKDSDYQGFSIKSKQEFVDLINSFNPPYYHQATLESKKTIFLFEGTHYFPIYKQRAELLLIR